MRKLLKGRQLNAEDTKWYFEKYLEESGLRCDEFLIDVLIDKETKSVDVRFDDLEYGHPVVFIPIGREANGIELLNLIAHEGRHIIANRFGVKLGLEGLSFGRDWETTHKGNAKLEEVEIKRNVLGDEYSVLE